MTKNEKAAPKAAFRHETTTLPDGTIMYDCPMEIKSQADLAAYGISWADCKTLRFNGSEKVVVYFLQVESREVADYQWAYLNNQHNHNVRNARCVIPGRRKAFIKCPVTNSCSKCPYRDIRLAPVISWDRLIDGTGYNPTVETPSDERAIARVVYREVRSKMDAADSRIARAFELYELHGYTVKEIADELGVSISFVYHLLARAKSIGKTYKEEIN